MGQKESTLGLIPACRAGKVHKVNELLENGAAVNYHDQAGNTPLTTAIYFGFDDVFDRLILQPGIDFEADDVVRPLAICVRH